MISDPDEILDLVDEKDEIIGEVKKSEANSDPKLIHREIRIVIFDSQNRILLQQRSFKKKKYPGYWALTAGHVLKGLAPRRAAHKELMEELGFDLELKFLYKRLVSTDGERHFAYCYIGKYSGQEIKIDSDEVEQVKFFTKDDFMREHYDLWSKIEMTDDKLDFDLVMDFWDGKLK